MRILTPEEVDKSIVHLKTCQYLGPVIDKYQKPTYELAQNPFRSLVRIIVYQQLSGKVANVIYSRFASLVGADEDVRPEQVLSHTPEQLKTVGLSRQKAEYISGIAQRFHELNLTPERLRTLQEAEVREALLPIKGVGPWSVDMFLMFHLCRPDIFPAGDLGIKNAFAALTQNPNPKPVQMTEFAERWKPYRTVASHYLWRSLENPTELP